jgi:D-sedoheptulose 7-phosphate isomerase
MNELDKELKQSFQTCRRLIDFLETEAWPILLSISGALYDCLKGGGTVYACGNGGSATQATHFAAELIGRFNKQDKRALPVFALADNTAVTTAISNDYSFDEVFARQLDGLGRRGDCLLVLSTSGNSENIVRACRTAKKKGLQVFAFTGRGGGKLARLCDRILMIPDSDTPRIQEAHLVSLHTVCWLVERRLFGLELHPGPVEAGVPAAPEPS